MGVSQKYAAKLTFSSLMLLSLTFNRNPYRNRYNGYINPYYWVDDHPLLYGNNGNLDPGTCWFH